MSFNEELQALIIKYRDKGIRLGEMIESLYNNHSVLRDAATQEGSAADPNYDVIVNN